MENDQTFDINAYQMLESMTESILITTTELQSPGPFIIYVNPAFEKMTGWKRMEVIGKSPRIMQGENTDYKIFNNLRDRLENGEIWSGRTVNYKKDGSEFFMEWSIVPIRNKSGEVYEYLAVQKDVTHQVITEQKLQLSREQEQRQLVEIKEKNKELGKLIAKQERTLDLFVKYVPEPIVKKALSGKGKNIRKGEQLEVALLFCDIRRFTTIAERLTPEKVVLFLNEYYSMMSEVIKEHNGTINQFVGDEIFVSFGAPEPIEDPEISAVRCAMDMIRKLNESNSILIDITGERTVVGIGVHFGPIIAGNLGSDDRLSYSITGDAVNTAKRLESLTNELPNGILISQSIYERVKDLVETKPLGEVKIKGKNRRENVYMIIQ